MGRKKVAVKSKITKIKSPESKYKARPKSSADFVISVDAIFQVRDELKADNARLEKKMEKFSGVMVQRFKALEDEMRLKMGQQGHRSDGLEVRMDNLEHRMDNLEHRMDNLEHRMDNLEHRMDNLEHRMDLLEHRMTKLELGMEELKDRMTSMEKTFEETTKSLKNIVQHLTLVLANQKPMLEYALDGYAQIFDRQEQLEKVSRKTNERLVGIENMVHQLKLKRLQKKRSSKN